MSNHHTDKLSFIALDLESLCGPINFKGANKISIISVWRSFFINNNIIILGPGVNKIGLKIEPLNIAFFYLISKFFGSDFIIKNLIKRAKKKGGKIFFVGSIYNYYSSPSLFSHIFFNSSYIIFVQHGGNFGEYLINDYEDLEKIYSDKYCNWSISNDGISQTRFGFFHRSIAMVNSIMQFKKYIRLVAYPRENGPGEVSNNLVRLPLIEAFINSVPLHFRKLLIFHEHPENSQNRFYFKDMDVICSSKSIGSVAGRNDLIIFDGPSHTFMYYCMVNKIPFVILWKEDYFNGMTERFINFYKTLKEMNLLLDDFDRDFDYEFTIKNAEAASEHLYKKCSGLDLVKYLDDLI